MLECLLLNAALAVGQLTLPIDKPESLPPGQDAPTAVSAPQPLAAPTLGLSAPDNAEAPAGLRTPDLTAPLSEKVEPPPSLPEADPLPAGDKVNIEIPASLVPPADPQAVPFALTAQDKPADEAKVEAAEIEAALLPRREETPAAVAAAVASIPPDRWLLTRVLQGSWLGTVMYDTRLFVLGWFDVSYTCGTAGRLNLPESFNYRSYEPDMQQGWVRFGRSVVTSGTTQPTFGFQFDLLTGTDYRFTLPRGIWNEQLVARNGLPNIYGVDPLQMYGEAFFPTIGRGLDVKVGRFYCIYGVESLEAPANQLISHCYSFSNGSPFTHTGVLATYTLTPEWTFQGAITAGSDVFLDAPTNEPTFTGSVQYTQPGGRNIVKCSTVLGSGKFNVDEAFNNLNVCDMVWTHTFNPVLIYNLECLYGYQYNVPDVGFSNWWGVINYLTYTITPRWAVTSRLEFFDDPQGVRTNSAPGATPDDCKGLYTALTVGMFFKPWRQPSGNGHIILRPELRYDRNWESKPFNGQHDLFTAAGDIILRW